MAEEQTKVSEAGEATPKVPKHRSPNYPAIGLEKAIERARAIQAQAKHHPLSITAALNIWKYKMGAGNQIVAALKSFGLIDVKGEKEGRQLRLTDAAIRILGNAPDRADLLKAAALKPGIHKELWDKYEGELPADSIMRDYLRWERNFNEEAVDGFIAQFRDTIEFAKVKISDKLRSGNDFDDDDDDDDDDVIDDDKDNLKMDTGVKKQKNKAPVLITGLMYLPLILPRNPQAGVLQVPMEMTKKEYELLKRQIDSYMGVVLVTAVADDEEQGD
jgi:hypothetical protein